MKLSRTICFYSLSKLLYILLPAYIIPTYILTYIPAYAPRRRDNVVLLTSKFKHLPYYILALILVRLW